MPEWRVADKAVFKETLPQEFLHVRIYCGHACVAILPIFDDSDISVATAMELAAHLASFVNNPRSNADVIGLTRDQIKRSNTDKISVIKEVRMKYGIGLRESKAIVDLFSQLGPI